MNRYSILQDKNKYRVIIDKKEYKNCDTLEQAIKERNKILNEKI
jgi:ribosomal protein S18